MKTEQDIREWVDDLREEDTPEYEEVVEAFRVIFGRSPMPEDGDERDWFSLICSWNTH